MVRGGAAFSSIPALEKRIKTIRLSPETECHHLEREGVVGLGKGWERLEAGGQKRQWLYHSFLKWRGLVDGGTAHKAVAQHA